MLKDKITQIKLSIDVLLGWGDYIISETDTYIHYYISIENMENKDLIKKTLSKLNMILPIYTSHRYIFEKITSPFGGYAILDPDKIKGAMVIIDKNFINMN